MRQLPHLEGLFYNQLSSSAHVFNQYREDWNTTRWVKTKAELYEFWFGILYIFCKKIDEHQLKSPRSFTLKCLWKFFSGIYSPIVKGIAWEKILWKYSTVETSLKGGINIVFFFWIFLRTRVKVAAKNVVICRGTPRPLKNRVRYKFLLYIIFSY